MIRQRPQQYEMTMNSIGESPLNFILIEYYEIIMVILATFLNK